MRLERIMERQSNRERERESKMLLFIWWCSECLSLSFFFFSIHPVCLLQNGTSSPVSLSTGVFMSLSLHVHTEGQERLEVLFIKNQEKGVSISGGTCLVGCTPLLSKEREEVTSFVLCLLYFVCVCACSHSRGYARQTDMTTYILGLVFDRKRER